MILRIWLRTVQRMPNLRIQFKETRIHQLGAKFETARDFDGSQIPVTTGGLELRNSYMQCSFMHLCNSISGFGIPEFATLRQE